MNGHLRDQRGVVPVAVSLMAILWTTMVLTTVQSNLVADDPEDLALAYLLPTIFIAIFFGSTLAVARHPISALTSSVGVVHFWVACENVWPVRSHARSESVVLRSTDALKCPSRLVPRAALSR